jgi:hypothetical protein
LHWKLEPTSLELKRKVTERRLVLLAGAASILVLGGPESKPRASS